MVKCRDSLATMPGILKFGSLAAVARLTGLEPATPGVTGRYSNQLSYNRPLPTTGMPWREACIMPLPPPRQALQRSKCNASIKKMEGCSAPRTQAVFLGACASFTDCRPKR